MLISKRNEQFKNFKSSYQGKQKKTTEEIGPEKVIGSTASDFMLLLYIYQQKAVVLSGVGFEPTPTRVDCDLNAAP